MFEYCDLSMSIFDDADATKARFYRTVLQMVHFVRATADGSEFVECVMDAGMYLASFRNTRMIRSDLTDCAADCACLYGADFSGSCLSGCRVPPV